jgi:hypothetical protein
MTRIRRLSPALLLATFLISHAYPALAERSALPSATVESMKATERQVAEFTANKTGLLKSNPIGGVQLSATAKALVLAQPSLIDDLLELIKQANTRQAAAIGAGIGQAAKILTATDAELANSLAAKIAAYGNEQVLAGYNAGSHETSTFAVSGSGGFSGVGTGGPVNASPPAGGGSSRSDQAQTGATPNQGAQSRSFGGAATSCTDSVSPFNPC